MKITLFLLMSLMFLLPSTSSSDSLKQIEPIATLKGHQSAVEHIAFSPDGKLIVSSSYNGIVKLWDLMRLQEVATLKGFRFSLNNLVFSPNGKYLVGAKSDGEFLLWDVEQQKEIITSELGDRRYKNNIVISPNSKLIAVYNSKSVKLWDVEHRQLIAERKDIGHIVFSPDGKLIASSKYKDVKLWNLEQSIETYSLKGHTALIRDVAFSPDGKILASASFDSTVKLWDVEQRKEIATLTGFNGWVKSVAFSPDGRILVSHEDMSASIDFDGNTYGDIVRLWNVEQRKEIATLKHNMEERINSVTFSPVGNLIAIEMKKGKSKSTIVKLWDVEQRQEIATLKYEHSIYDFAFSPAGNLIATTCEDNTVKLWDVLSLAGTVLVKSSADKSIYVVRSGDTMWGISLALGTTVSALRKTNSIKRGSRIYVGQKLKIPLGAKQFTKKNADSDIDLSRLEISHPVILDYPPVLTGIIKLCEPSGNNLLDADERGILVVTLTNNGQGLANGLDIAVTPESFYSSLSIEKPKRIERLAPSQSTTIEIPISAGLGVATQQTTFTVSIRESNGFDLYPSLKISFGTQELIPPVLAVANYAIEDFNNNRKIERSEMVKITARVQNSGNGKARKTQATVSVGANVFISPDSKTTFDLSELAPGEYKDIEFSLFANNKATSVPVTITLTEHYGKYGSEKKLDLPFEVIQKAPTEMVVEGTFAEVRSLDDAPELLADVDRNIPQAVIRNNDAVAVIISNRNYTCGDIPTVDYAVNDASVMRSYLIDLLGYENGNIIYLENASQSDLKSVFGTEQFGGRLANLVKDNISDVFIYYSGHGAPDPNSKRGYFLPVDCCPNDVRLNGYPLDLFYKNMGKLQPKSLTIAIDACFSGGSNKGMLIKNASPVSIEVENQATVGDNSAVFTSSASNEISSWYPEKKHGLFTYFFLKGLRGDADSNKDKKLTSQELHDFISDKTKAVPYYARSIYNGRVQTPSVSGDSKMVLVEYK